MKGWVSLDEIKEAASQGVYLAGIYCYRVLRDLPVWTLKHGHFLIMGGIRLVEPPEEASTTTSKANTVEGQTAASETINVQPRSSASLDADTEKGRGQAGKMLKPKEGRVTILTLEMLEKLAEDKEFKIQTTEEGIADKSKGDALSKLIFILKSTWFILQCLGRRGQGLDLTHLELTTVALASLNGIIFVLWWDKPLGVQTPVRVTC